MGRALTGIERLVREAEDRVTDEWGRAYELMGPRIQRALLAEAVLAIANRMDDAANPEFVREFVTAGWTMAVDRSGF